MTPTQSRVELVRAMLDHELRSGTRAPGSSISIKEVSDQLRISGTPVREALERLVGEGRVIVTGSRHGFAVPRFGVRVLSGLYSFAALLVEAAYREGPPIWPGYREALPVGTTASAVITQSVLAAVTDHATNPVVSFEAARTAALLAPYRAVEPRIISGWRDELQTLIGDMRQARSGTRAIRFYTKTRRALAGDLIDAAEQAGSV